MSYYKKKYKYKNNFFKKANIISEQSIALPVGPHINIYDLNYIQKLVKESLRKYE